MGVATVSPAAAPQVGIIEDSNKGVETTLVWCDWSKRFTHGWLQVRRLVEDGSWMRYSTPSYPFTLRFVCNESSRFNNYSVL